MAKLAMLQSAQGERVSAMAPGLLTRSFVLAAVVACGSASDASDGSPRMVGPELTPTGGSPRQPVASEDARPANPELDWSRSGEYAGTYYVPVPPELEPYATFPIDSIRLDRRDDELDLDYDLPELLLGEELHVSFRGPIAEDGSATLIGSNGVAVCRAAGAGWSCREEFYDIEVDAGKTQRLLAPLTDAEAGARRRVSARFGEDPIGVLSVASVR